MLKRAIRRLWRLISPDTRSWLVRKTQSSFTVSAAAIIFNEKKEVLLLNHVLRPNSGWGIPGGFIEKGEQAEEPGAIRHALDLEQQQCQSLVASQIARFAYESAATSSIAHSLDSVVPFQRKCSQRFERRTFMFIARSRSGSPGSQHGGGRRSRVRKCLRDRSDRHFCTQVSSGPDPRIEH